MTAVAGTAAPGRRPGAVTLVLREVKYQQLLFWRNRFGALFTVVFATLFLILLSATNSGHISYLHGINYAEYYTPGFIAYGVMSACFNNLAITTVVRRETGLLKRLRLSPLPGWALIAAIMTSAALVSAFSSVLLLVIGIAFYGVSLGAAAILPLIVGVIVGAACFSAMGLAVSTFVPNEDAAGAMISIIFFILLFLSGLWFPLKAGSALGRAAGYLPIRRLILVIEQPFFGHGLSPWDWRSLGVVVIWGAVGAFVAAHRFRWSRWRDDHPTRAPRRRATASE